MNREIKFRAWDKAIKKMGKVTGMTFSLGDGELFYVGTEFSSITTKGLVKQTFEIMQYTGLKDKNGKEIYEGDIVDFSIYQDRRPMVVEWNSRGWSPFWEENSSEELADLDKIAVIGNIFENKALLND